MSVITMVLLARDWKVYAKLRCALQRDVQQARNRHVVV
jgi:hypothetical protein